MNREQEKLLQIYKTVLPSVERVGVYPNIADSSKHNPYLSLLYKDFPLSVQSISPLKPGYLFSNQTTIVHYNWLESSNLRGILVLLIKLPPLFLFILFGGKVIWTVHNSAPHRGKLPRINRFIRTLFARKCALLLVHSEAAREKVIARFAVGKEKIEIINHPRYPVERIPQEQAKERLSAVLPHITGPVFLMYGYIASYKGIDEVVKAFRERTYTLIIAGKIKEREYFEQIKQSASDCSSIILLPRFITAEEEQALFSFVDGVIFNFRHILTSGSLILAGSYGTPIYTRPFASAIPEEFSVTTFDSMAQLIETIGSTHA